MVYNTGDLRNWKCAVKFHVLKVWSFAARCSRGPFPSKSAERTDSVIVFIRSCLLSRTIKMVNSHEQRASVKFRFILGKNVANAFHVTKV